MSGGVPVRVRRCFVAVAVAVADADAITLHRAPGKRPIPGVPRQTIQPDADGPRRSLGLGTIRRARHVNQADVAKRMGVAQPSVSVPQFAGEHRVICAYLGDRAMSAMKLAQNPDSRRGRRP